MDTRKLQIIETRDKSPGMEGAVHIGTSKERLIPYVGREVAAEMVRRWNAYPSLVGFVDRISSLTTTDENNDGIDLENDEAMDDIIEAARALLNTLKA